jgi:signal transduction histidine kinase
MALAGLKRLLRSTTVARLVGAIFVAQIMVMAAAILLLRVQMLQVIETDRARQLQDVRDELLGAWYEGGSAELTRFVAERRGTIADPLIFVALMQPGGPGATPVLANLSAAPDLAPTARPVALQVAQPGRDSPAPAVATATVLSDGTRLVVGALTAPDRRLDLAFAGAFSVTAVLAILLSLAASLAIGYVISRRTHAIADTAAALASGDFAARVGTGDAADGFEHLRRQINLMADRIAALVGELQAISGALAHDLRSPVARLRTAIDTALARADDGPAAEALLLARADAEALDTMLGSALDLARIESGALNDRRAPLDLLTLATDLVELYEPMAEHSGVALSVAGEPSPVSADRELVSRALANLIDNALKYGGNRIAVAVRGERGEIILEVVDNGEGIAAADRPRAIERFARLDPARSGAGAGIGLAMVAAVARLHGGRLELDQPAEGTGLVARMIFPHP